MSEAGLLAFKKQVILNKNIFEGKNKWFEFKNTFDGWWSQGDQKAWVKSCPMSIKSCPKILLLDLMTLCQKAKNVGNLGWKSIPQAIKKCLNIKKSLNLVTWLRDNRLLLVFKSDTPKEIETILQDLGPIVAISRINELNWDKTINTILKLIKMITVGQIR